MYICNSSDSVTKKNLKLLDDNVVLKMDFRAEYIRRTRLSIKNVCEINGHIQFINSPSWLSWSGEHSVEWKTFTLFCFSCPLGDILLSVNGIDLTGVSRGEAVARLKNVSSSVVFKALELKVCETTEGENGDLLPDANLRSSNQSEWSPSWVMWLELPRWVQAKTVLWHLCDSRSA